MNNPTDWTIDEFKAIVAGESYEFTDYWPPGESTKIQINKLKSYKPSEDDPSVKCSWAIIQAKGRRPQAEKDTGKGAKK